MCFYLEIFLLSGLLSATVKRVSTPLFLLFIPLFLKIPRLFSINIIYYTFMS